MYANNKITGFLLVLVIALYFFSPKTGIHLVTEEVQANEISNTGKTSQKEVGTGMVQKVQTGGKENGKKEQKGNTNDSRQVFVICDVSCKIKTLKDIGIRPEIAESLVNNCKVLALDPVHCIKVGASILKAESNLGKNCNGFNCLGMGGGAYKYKSYDEGIKDWVTRYVKYWYKAKSAPFFYPSVGHVSKSRYCTSEESSGSDVGCPNGQKHAQEMWNKLDNLF